MARRELLLANLTSDTQRIDLSSATREPANLVMLDEAAFVAATSDPAWATGACGSLGDHEIELPSYAVAFLTLGAGQK